MKAPAVTDDKERRYKNRKIYFATGKWKILAWTFIFLKLIG